MELSPAQMNSVHSSFSPLLCHKKLSVEVRYHLIEKGKRNGPPIVLFRSAAGMLLLNTWQAHQHEGMVVIQQTFSLTTAESYNLL